MVPGELAAESKKQDKSITLYQVRVTCRLLCFGAGLRGQAFCYAVLYKQVGNRRIILQGLCYYNKVA